MIIPWVTEVFAAYTVSLSECEGSCLGAWHIHPEVWWYNTVCLTNQTTKYQADIQGAISVGANGALHCLECLTLDWACQLMAVQWRLFDDDHRVKDGNPWMIAKLQGDQSRVCFVCGWLAQMEAICQGFPNPNINPWLTEVFLSFWADPIVWA